MAIRKVCELLKFIKEYRYTSIVIGLLITSIIASLWQEFGNALSGYLVQIGRCNEGDFACFLWHYGIGFMPFIVMAYFVDLVMRRSQNRVRAELRRLIEKGERLFLESTQSSRYKNRKKEWIPLMKEWDIKEMQPFVKKHFGEDDLLVYKSNKRDVTFNDPVDPDYGDRRSILITRIERAQKLLERLK